MNRRRWNLKLFMCVESELINIQKTKIKDHRVVSLPLSGTADWDNKKQLHEGWALPDVEKDEGEQLRCISPNKIISHKKAMSREKSSVRCFDEVEQDKRSGPKDQINNSALHPSLSRSSVSNLDRKLPWNFKHLIYIESLSQDKPALEKTSGNVGMLNLLGWRLLSSISFIHVRPCHIKCSFACRQS